MGIFEDMFYPGNPARRDKLQRNIGALLNNMKTDETATNDLVKIVNEHLHADIKLVAIDEKDTVRKNAQRIVDCIHAVNKVVKEKVQEMKGKLDDGIFKKLMDISVAFEDKIKIAEDASEAVAGIGSVVGLLSASSIAEMDALEGIVEVVGETIAAGFSAIVLSVLFLGIDAIAEAIIGAIERDKLNEEIEKTDKCVGAMQAQTGPFIMKVEELKVRIEMIKPKGT